MKITCKAISICNNEIIVEVVTIGMFGSHKEQSFITIDDGRTWNEAFTGSKPKGKMLEFLCEQAYKARVYEMLMAKAK